MADHVPHELKIERLERLVEVTQRSARRRNEARIGTVEQVLVEGASRTDDTLLRGRTRRNTTVNFAGEAHPGDLVDVRIEAATSTTLRGSRPVLAAA
jgi:tRNA-2-methylthio-N6-dimethylallyladenosine synthase